MASATRADDTPMTTRRRGAKWAGVMRLAAYLCALTTGLLIWSVCEAYADAKHTVLRLGDQLASEMGPGLAAAPEVVEINRQLFFLSSQQSELSVSEVLDQFAASCGGPARAPASAERAHSELAALLDDPLRYSVIRAQDEAASEGMLACLARRERVPLATFVERVAQFMASGDLSSLGELRYVTARRRDHGKTHVIAVWTHGSFRPGALFPESGDAPGTELQDVPRPPESTRALAASAPGRSYALNVYDSSHTLEDVLRFYDRELSDSGWECVPLPPEMRPTGGMIVRAFTRRGRALIVAAARAARARSEISLLDMGAVARSSGENALQNGE